MHLLKELFMTNAVDESRAPESSAHPSVTGSGDPPGTAAACDGLKRLVKRFPKQVEKILRVGEAECAGEGQCDIWNHLLEQF